MTSQRTHARLESAVLSTLSRLPQVYSVGVVEVLQESGVEYLRYKSPCAGARACSVPLPQPADKQPLKDMRHLHQALVAGRSYCLARWSKPSDPSGPQGHSLWLIVWQQQKAVQCIELRQYPAFDAQRMELVFAVFQVFQNCQNLLEYSKRDALTGLLNRKSFDDWRFQSLDSAGLGGALEAETPLHGRPRADVRPPRDAVLGRGSRWLAMIDIDNFKQINDQFGHLYGDEILVLVANILRQNSRHTDRIFRYGGEEFIVLLQEAELASVKSILERLCQAVAACCLPQVGRITVSIGCARADGMALTEGMEQADRALYYAKSNGKNQVAYYQELWASELGAS